MKTNRSNFSGKIGFILAAAGSAVGLGNIWRFPYLAAKYGGGSFLICYIILAVTFGFTLMVAEIAIGRKTGLSAIGAFQKLDKRADQRQRSPSDWRGWGTVRNYVIQRGNETCR
jgi:neurotransmitter:Na+ symporter, NSS family